MEPVKRQLTTLATGSMPVIKRTRPHAIITNTATNCLEMLGYDLNGSYTLFKYLTGLESIKCSILSQKMCRIFNYGYVYACIHMENKLFANTEGSVASQIRKGVQSGEICVSQLDLSTPAILLKDVDLKGPLLAYITSLVGQTSLSDRDINALRMQILFDLHVKGYAPTSVSAEELWNYHIALAKDPMTAPDRALKIGVQLVRSVVWGYFNEVPGASSIARHYAHILATNPQLTDRQREQGKMLLDLLDISHPLSGVTIKDRSHLFSPFGLLVLEELKLKGLVEIMYKQPLSFPRVNSLQQHALFTLSNAFNYVNGLSLTKDRRKHLCLVIRELVNDEPIRPNIRKMCDLFLALFEIDGIITGRTDFEIAALARQEIDHPVQFRETYFTDATEVAKTILIRLRLLGRTHLISPQEAFEMAYTRFQRQPTNNSLYLACIFCLQSSEDLRIPNSPNMFQRSTAIQKLQEMLATEADPKVKLDFSWELTRHTTSREVTNLREIAKFVWENSAPHSARRIESGLRFISEYLEDWAAYAQLPDILDHISFLKDLLRDPNTSIKNTAMAKLGLSIFFLRMPNVISRNEAIAYCAEVANDPRMGLPGRENATEILGEIIKHF